MRVLDKNGKQLKVGDRVDTGWLRGAEIKDFVGGSVRVHFPGGRGLVVGTTDPQSRRVSTVTRKET